MNNTRINQILQSGADAHYLLNDPSSHDAKNHSFFPHICGSVFFEEKPLKVSNKEVQLHLIALRKSERLYDFFSRYDLKYKIDLFEAIDAKDPSFSYSDYGETQGIPPVQGQEGHLGCTLSHFYLWKKLKNTTCNYHLILEDDVFFTRYAEKALEALLHDVPDDADLIFVNGRSSEKLYAACRYENGKFTNLPEKFIFTRKEMLTLMASNIDKLRSDPENGSPILFSGTDGYILTRSGVNKLNQYINKYGLEGVPSGAGQNIDLILTAITTDIYDHEKIDMAYNVDRKVMNGSISEKPIINSYVCSFPLVDSSDRAGIGTGSEIGKLRIPDIDDNDIRLIRDISIEVSSLCPDSSLKLMKLVSALKPNDTELKRYLTDLEKRY